jgi:translation initiation factor IF-1
MKIHIDIRDDIDAEDAVRRVAQVISGGKISQTKTRKHYCWLTSWKDGICVSVNPYRKSDCFVVWKNKNN